MIKKLLYWLTMLEAKPFVERFIADTDRIAEVQKKVLLRKVQRARATVFGRHHNFSSIKGVEDFRRQVPVRTYEDLYPYINRIVQAETDVLFPSREKVVMFALSSGTSSEPKYIPVTTSFLKEYKATSLLWGIFAIYDHPEMLDGKILPLVSPYDEACTGHGIPCGAISGLIAKSQKYIAHFLYAIPWPVFNIQEPVLKYYTIMRLALPHEISLISSANPSTILSVARLVDARKEDLIRDIHDGTLIGMQDFPADIRSSIKPLLRPERVRARELESIVRKEGRLLLKDCWHKLALIGCWKGGTLTSYLKHFPEYFGEATVRDIGLVASEGRMTVPMTDTGCSGILDIHSHFFEFIPEQEEDIQNPTTLLPEELEAGKNYFLVVTTSSGLYRYNIHDLVRVDGFYRKTPMVSFLSKGSHFSSLTGEKLSEYQVTKAAETACMRLDNAVLNTFVFSPCWDEVPYYTLLVEQDPAYTPEMWKRFLLEMDRSLQEINIEYAQKRRSQRLAVPSLRMVADGTFEKLKRDRIRCSRGRAEQYKHTFLVSEIDFHKRFTVVGEIVVQSPSIQVP